MLLLTKSSTVSQLGWTRSLDLATLSKHCATQQSEWLMRSTHSSGWHCTTQEKGAREVSLFFFRGQHHQATSWLLYTKRKQRI